MRGRGMRNYFCWLALVMAMALVACGPARTQKQVTSTASYNNSPIWSEAYIDALQRLLTAIPEPGSNPDNEYKCFEINAENDWLSAVPCQRGISTPHSPDGIGDWEMVIRPDWPWDQAMVAGHDWPYDWAMVVGHGRATTIGEVQKRSRTTIYRGTRLLIVPENPE